MPKLPLQTPQTSLNVPGVQAPPDRYFGRLGQAAEETSQQISRGSESLNDQIQKVAAIDSSTQAIAQDKVDFAQKKLQLQLSSPDGLSRDSDGNLIIENGKARTVQDDLHDYMNDRYQASQNNMPSQMAQEMYRGSMLPHLSNQIDEMGLTVQQMQVKAHDVTGSQMQLKYGSDLSTNPDMSHFYNYFNDVRDFHNGVVGMVHNQTAADEKSQAGGEQLAENLVRGAYTSIYDLKKNATPDQRMAAANLWNQRLLGTDEESKQRAALGLPTLATIMKPDQNDIERKKILSMLPTALAQDNADFKWRFNQSAEAQKTGGADEATYNQQMATLYRQPGIDPPEKFQLASKMATNRAIGLGTGKTWEALSAPAQLQSMGDLSQMAVRRVQADAQRFGVQITPDVLKNVNDEVAKGLTTHFNEIQAEKSKDSTAWAQKINGLGAKIPDELYGSPSIASKAEDIQAGIRSQDTLMRVGPPLNPNAIRGPVTEPQSQIIAARLKDPSTLSEEQAAKYFNSGIGTAFQEHTPRVIAQMIKDQNLSPGWQLLQLHLNDDAAQTATIQALRGGAETKKLFADLHPDNSNVPTARSATQDLNSAIAKSFGPVVSAWASANPGSQYKENLNAAMIDAGKTYAMKLWLQDQSLSMDTAAKTAYEQMAGKHLLTGSVGGQTWGSSSREVPYAVPNTLGNRPLGDLDNANLKANFSDWKDHLEELPYAAPAGMANSEHFIDAVKQNGGWSRDEHWGGYVYRYSLPQPNGTMGETYPLTGRDGKPIVKPFADAFNPPKIREVAPDMSQMK